MKKEEIIQLIASGQLSEALNKMTTSIPEARRMEVVQLQSQLSTLEQQERMGVISHSDANLKQNQITAAALSILSDPTTHNKEQNTPNDTAENKPIQQADKIYNIGNIDNANFS